MGVFSNSTGGSGVFGTIAAAPVPTAASPSHPHGITGLLENFYKDLKGAVGGLGPGIYHLGSQIAHGDTHGLGQDAKAIYQQFSHTYGPAFQGDFHTFGKRLYDDPLGPVLDVLSIISGGAALVGRVGKGLVAVDEAGALGRAGAKIAGLQKVPGIHGVEAEAKLATESGGHRFNMAGAPGVVTKQGNLYLTKERVLGGAENADRAANLGRYSANPYHAFQQKAGLLVSEALPNFPLIGAASRIGRLEAQALKRSEHRTLHEVQTHAVERGTQKALKEVPKHKRDLVQLAVNTKAAKLTHHEEAAALEHRARFLSEHGHHIEPALKVAQKVVDTHGAEAQAFATKQLEHATTDPEKAAFKAISHYGPERAVAELQWAKQAHHEGALGKTLTRAAQHRQIASGAVAEHGAIVNRLLDINRPVALKTSETLAKGGADAKSPAEATALAAGKTPEAAAQHSVDYLIPETRPRTNRQKGAESGSVRRDISAPTRPSSSKERTGYNRAYGLNDVNLQVIPWTLRVARSWLRAKQSWDAVLHYSQPVHSTGSIPKGWSRVPREQITDFLKQLNEFVNEKAPVAFGESPQLDQIRELAAQMQAKFVEQDAIVPTRILKRLSDEISPRTAGGFANIVDAPTAVFRMATVSVLRPAFVSNNIIGQTAQLLLAHGILGSLRPLLQLASDPEVRAAWREIDSKGAGGILQTGNAHSLGRENLDIASRGIIDRLGTGIAVKTKDKLQALNQLGQAISDDPFRRISFLAEIDKPARRLMRARSISYTEAAHQLLDDPKFLDRVERKVLDDMVDFSNLSKQERETIRRYFLPFYGWIKGSTRLAGKVVTEDPLKAAALEHTGQLGETTNKHDLGALPDIATGIIPLGHGMVLSSAPANPFQTPVDFAGLLTSPFQSRPEGADNPIAQANPAIKAFISAFTGYDPFTHQQVPGGTPLMRGINQFYKGLPAVQLANGPGDAQANKSRLFPQSNESNLLKYLLGTAAPRNFNTDEAHKLAAQGPRSYAQLQVPTDIGGRKFAPVNDGSGDLYMVGRFHPKGDSKTKGVFG